MDTGGENTDVQTVKVLWQGEVKLNTIHIQFNFNSKVPPYPNNKTTHFKQKLGHSGKEKLCFNKEKPRKQAQGGAC